MLNNFFKKIIKKIFNYFGLNIKRKSYENNLSPDIKEYEKRLIDNAKQFSMTSKIRMLALCRAFKYVKENNIEGDLVECGVWRGGNLILLQNLMDEFKNFDKKIIGFDTFEGMTEPNQFDVNLKNQKAKELLSEEKKIESDVKENNWCFSSYDSVLRNFNENTKSNNLILVKGDVKKTLNDNKNLPKKISILRLDTDFYESTKIELEKLYPLLSKNGILIIDDYGHWQGAKKAVDEYFSGANHKPFLNIVDYSCRLIIK